MSAQPTARSEKQTRLILDAAISAMGKYGYAATSLARVAEEAGTTKRMVLYYFESRDALIDALVRRIGDELAAQTQAAIDGYVDPSQALTAGFQRLWSRLTANPGLLAAYFGLMSEAVVDDRLSETVGHLSEPFAQLVARFVRDAEGAGLRLTIDPDVFGVLVMAGFRGLLLEYLENGASAALDGARVALERSFAAFFAADEA